MPDNTKSRSTARPGGLEALASALVPCGSQARRNEELGPVSLVGASLRREGLDRSQERRRRRAFLHGDDEFKEIMRTGGEHFGVESFQLAETWLDASVSAHHNHDALLHGNRSGGHCFGSSLYAVTALFRHC